MTEHFVLHDGGVVPYVDLLDSHGRYLSFTFLYQTALDSHEGKTTHLSDHYSSQSVGNRRIHANEVKLDGRRGKSLNGDDEVLRWRGTGQRLQSWLMTE